MNEELREYFQPGKKNLLIIYLLYLAGFISPLLRILGVTLAYINKDSAHDNSHYVFVCRTFWIELLCYIISTITPLIFVSNIIGISVSVWYVIRIICGMNLLLKDKSHPHPHTLLFN